MCRRVFNKTIILLGLAGYEMVITNSVLRASLGLSLKVGRGRGTWDAGTWGRGTRRRGDVGTRGRGDAGTRGRGDAGTRGRGDAGTRGLRNSETRGDSRT